MSKPARKGRRKSTSQINAQAKAVVAVRLPAWSEWDRNVIRGVQRFAHDRPRWRVYVETGDFASSEIVRGGIPLDGLITSMAAWPAPTWRHFLRKTTAKIVSISFMTPSVFSSMAQVKVDEAKMAAAIGRHLLAAGFRQFGYFGRNRPGIKDARLDAFLAYAKAEGCPCHILPVFWNRTSEMDITIPMVAKWIAKLPKPVGIVAWNMRVARMLVTACNRTQVPVPGQVAVVAWDDDPLLAETLEPTISSAVLPAERLGFEAARLLDQLLSGIKIPTAPLLIAPTNVLRVRQSSDVSALEGRDAYLALQYIREHGIEPLKVNHVAAALRISRSKLEREFVRVIGQTPYDAILKVRFDRACQLLTETDWSLERVATRCGLGTKETLRRVFAKLEHVTPGVYRARFRPAE